MLIDYREDELSPDIEADICIIGAGAAGIALAHELMGSGLRIALLESGGLDHEPEIQALNAGDNTGLNYFPLEGARLRYFGGTTNHWNGWCAPLNALDFARREWVPLSGWPITLDDLTPYYERAQPLFELGAFGYNEAHWRGAAWAPPALDVDKLITRVWQISPPTRFGQHYREALTQADDVAVYLYANATTFLPSESGERVDSVGVRSLNGRRGQARARHFVLACGGIENARVLMLTDTRLPQPLGAGGAWTGRCFMEHPHVPCGELASSDPEMLADAWYHRFSVDDSPQLRAGLCLSESRQARDGLLNASATLEFVPRLGGYERLSRLKDQLTSRRLPDDFAQQLWAVVSDFDDVSHNFMRRARGEPFRRAVQPSPVTLLARSEQAPNRSSRLRLVDERDALGLERVALEWRLNELDRHTLRRLTTLVGEEIGRLGLGRVQLAEWLRDDADHWPAELQGGWHHMGTTRMAASPATGVVDGQCRLHGMDNLYIAGSSVFPTGGYANPTLTLVALALRLADHLKATSSA